MEREVRYCTTDDGVRIAFTVDGTGPPVVLSHFVYSFSLHHQVPIFENALSRLGEGRQLIRYDMRGVGLSERDVDNLAPAALIWDMEAVVDALGLASFTLIGVSHGSPRAVEYAALHPDQVTGLVLYEGYPRLIDVVPPHVLRALADLSRANWRLATRTFVDMGVRRSNESEGLRWAQMMEDSTTGGVVAKLIEAHMDSDISGLLNRVSCPALICQSVGQRRVPFELGQRMATQIPNATLVPLKNEGDGPFTQPGEAIQAINAFLPPPMPRVAGHVAPQPARLTTREIEILRHIASGRTSNEIAAQLALSVRTVGRHITNIYRKTGVEGRAEAAAYAIRYGIVNL